MAHSEQPQKDVPLVSFALRAMALERTNGKYWVRPVQGSYVKFLPRISAAGGSLAQASLQDDS